MNHVAIVGSGLIGRSWAIVFARAGVSVVLHDQDAEICARAKDTIAASLGEAAERDRDVDVAGTLARIRVAATLREAVAGADLVQESGPESVDVKRKLFAELDDLATPGTLLASSTSGIIASRFTEHLAGRARCFVAHPVNPPHLVPLVELSGAPWTSRDALERAKQIYGSVGQVPIVLKRELDGFVLNRLQAVLLAEAFRLVAEDYASPEDVDKAVKDGLGLRWSFMGPFETIELNAPGGIPDYCERYGPTMARLSGGNSNIFSGGMLETVMAQWRALRDAKAVAEKMRWRDLRLAALQRHKKSEAQSIPPPSNS
jgi:L-gulonate 3-dehydrogenase